MSTLTVNDLKFELRRSSARRALEITVDRGGELILSAPPEVSVAMLRDFVHRKRMWVYKQLAKKDALGLHTRTKEYVDGEGFAYLGRSYRLKLVSEADAAVKLQAGRFIMPTALAREGHAHMVRWYCEHARPWLARKVNDLAARARSNKLTPDEIQGSTFTVTNHGTGGSLFATPIINQPNVGILGVGAIQKRAVVISRGHPVEPSSEDSIAIRPMAYLSFTFDHRVLDGAGGDGFLMAVKQALEGWQ